MPVGHEYNHKDKGKGSIPGDYSREQAGPEAGYQACMASPQDLSHGLKLFGNRLCPFAHRSWWIALELGAPIEYLHVDMGGPRALGIDGRPGKFGKPPWYVREVNPSGTIPCCYHNGVPRFALRGSFEDDNIGHYLIQRFGGSGKPELIPTEPEREAAVRFFISWVGGLDMVGVGMRLLFEKDRHRAAELTQQLIEILRLLNARLIAQSATGPFFLGEQLTVADIHVAPFLDRWEATLAYWRNFEVLADPELTRLREMMRACRVRPAFQATSQTSDYYIWAERRTRWNANLVGEPWSEPRLLAKL